MSDPRAARLFDLGDAGSVVVRHSAQAVQLETITPGHGWRIADRFPKGWVARRRPSQRAGVTLCDGRDDSCTREAELEIATLADGRWEVAERHSRKHAALGHIDVGCGGVTVTWDGQRLTVDEPMAVPGGASTAPRDPRKSTAVGISSSSGRQGIATWSCSSIARPPRTHPAAV